MITPQRRRRRTTLSVFAAAMVAGLALAGCSASSDSTSTTPAAGGPGADNAAQGEAVAPGAPPVVKDESQTDSQQAPTQVEPQQRSLIYTGTIEVKVDDVVKAANQAVDIAVGAGGAVGGDRRTLDADRSQAQIILRVPADQFTPTLDKLAKLGVEVSRVVQTQDVTEAMVDLDARLATQRASVDRVRALLARAQTINEIVSIESELTRREAELASLEQRRTKLAGLVALSTITLNLGGPASSAPAAEAEESGFATGLKSGWKAFTTSVEVILTVAGWLLPWAVTIGLPLWLILWLLRRRRPTTTPPPTP